MPSRQVILGVDVGTSSSKAVLTSTDGVVLDTATIEHTTSRPAPGHVEMSADIWWTEFTSLATQLTNDRRNDVVAVGLSGMGPCVLLTDSEGQPLRPAILYGVDTRAEKQIQTLTETYGAEAILRRCGAVLSSQSVGPKLRWVAEHEPDVWSRARRLMMPASYLSYRLTGNYVLDYHSASQCTPLFDTNTMRWCDDWVTDVAEHLELPPLQWPGEVAGHTRYAVAGIAPGTPVITGTIDAWTEAVSVGAHRPGDLMVMYGTTMFLIATTADKVTSPVLWSAVGAFEGTRSLAGGLATSGAIAGWVRDLTHATFATLNAEAEACPAGANGLLLLPYFAGERTPIFDPDARGVVIGLTLAHERGDLYRAVLEGTAFAVRHNLEAMRDAGASISRVIAVGGGTRGGLWTQIVSDVIGLPQAIPSVTIGACFGAAALAAGLLVPVDVDRWNPTRAICEPDPANKDVYERAYRVYRDLYPATRPLVAQLQPSPSYC